MCASGLRREVRTSNGDVGVSRRWRPSPPAPAGMPCTGVGLRTEPGDALAEVRSKSLSLTPPPMPEPVWTATHGYVATALLLTAWHIQISSACETLPRGTVSQPGLRTGSSPSHAGGNGHCGTKLLPPPAVCHNYTLPSVTPEEVPYHRRGVSLPAG